VTAASKSHRIGRKTGKHLQAMEDAYKVRRRSQEARERARKAAAEVAAGVEETLGLGEERGEAFLKPKPSRDGRTAPARRRTGLDWLATRKPERITVVQHQIGLRWGDYWRAVSGEESIRSCMDDTVGGAGQTLKGVLNTAEFRAIARAKLNALNAILLGQQSLIWAMEHVCGREKTPREAARDGHEAIKIECLVVVALDMMVEGVGRQAYTGA
jgi:hypothetical protein